MRSHILTRAPSPPPPLPDVDNISIVPLTGPGHSLGTELHDHRGDSGLWLDWPGENANLVDAPEHADTVAELHQRVLDYIQLRPQTAPST